MQYLISFLEGIITFVSPCLLPMLPIYLSYLGGQNNGQNVQTKKRAAIRNAIGFVAGFTLVFVVLGAFAGTIGSFLRTYRTTVDIVAGSIVILFGLNFLGVLRIPLVNTNRQLQVKGLGRGFVSAIAFGMIFAVGWTPCVGAFLGSALMLAASAGESMKGILMLLCFSLGLGIPFILCALLIDQLKNTFSFIKRHYRVINLVSGGFLVIIGILMATGLIGYYLSLLTV